MHSVSAIIPLSRQIDECENPTQLSDLFDRFRANSAEFSWEIKSTCKLSEKVKEYADEDLATRIRDLCLNALTKEQDRCAIKELNAIICNSFRNKLIYFPGVYDSIKNNQTLLKMYLPMLISEGYESFYEELFDEQEIQEILKNHFPSNKPENRYLYPLKTKIEEDTLYISTITLKARNDPYAVLSKLAAAFKESPDIQIKVNYTDSKGIDASGLLRQFIEQLFQGLCEKNHPFIAFEKQLDGRYLPNAKQELDDTSLQHLVTLGRLLAFVARANGAYPIGEIFPERFFSAMQLMSETDIDTPFQITDVVKMFEIHRALFDDEAKAEFDKTLSLLRAPDGNKFNDNQHLLIKLMVLLQQTDGCPISPEQKAFLEGLGIECEDKFSEEVKIELAHNLAVRCQTKAIPLQAIARGFKECLLQDAPATVLMDLIQGKLSKELFKAKVEFAFQPIFGIEPTEEELRLQTELMAELKGWVDEWVDTHSLDEIRNVVRAITGAGSLTNALRFNICEAGGMFAHTCFNMVDVPTTITKQMFVDQLDEWAAGKGVTGFNRA